MNRDTQHQLQLIEADLTNGNFGLEDSREAKAIQFLLQTIELYRDDFESLEYDNEELQDKVDELEEALEILEGNAA